MNEIEFYIYDDQLWCMYPNGKNEQVTEKNNELVKSTLDKIGRAHV